MPPQWTAHLLLTLDSWFFADAFASGQELLAVHPVRTRQAQQEVCGDCSFTPLIEQILCSLCEENEAVCVTPPYVAVALRILNQDDAPLLSTKYFGRFARLRLSCLD